MSPTDPVEFDVLVETPAVNVVLMGPLGSGNRTQAVPLVEALGCRHLSTGSMAQARALLASDAPRDLVIALEVPEPVLVERLQGRARPEGRADDTAAVIEHRLQVFTKCTKPVLDLFAAQGLVRTIPAADPPDVVAGSILAHLPTRRNST